MYFDKLKNNFNIIKFFYSIKDVAKAYTEGIYADTPANRKLGRVGMSYEEWNNKNNKKEEKIDNISTYLLEKKLNNSKIYPRLVKDHGEMFLISLEKDDFEDKNIVNKTKQILENLGAKVFISKHSHFIKAFKKDIDIDENEKEIIELGNYQFDINDRTLIDKDSKKEISLTPKETRLLEILSSQSDFISKDALLEKIWGESNYYNSRSMDVHINNLKKKLKGDKNIKILTLPWKGFKLRVSKEKDNNIRNIVDNSSILKNLSGKKLDNVIRYSNSIEGVEGIKVSEDATDTEKKEAIAKFYIESGELEGNNKTIAEDLDSIIEDALEDSDNYDNNVKEEDEFLNKDGISIKNIPINKLADKYNKSSNKKEKEKIKNQIKNIKEKESWNDGEREWFFDEDIDEYVGFQRTEKKNKILTPTLKKINDYFGFEDENNEYFTDTPISMIMSDDKEFGDLIDKYTNYDILSQSGKYKNNGKRSNMLNCYITYDVVPKGTLDEDIELNTKQFTIDYKTTINDILNELGSRY